VADTACPSDQAEPITNLTNLTTSKSADETDSPHARTNTDTPDDLRGRDYLQGHQPAAAAPSSVRDDTTTLTGPGAPLGNTRCQSTLAWSRLTRASATTPASVSLAARTADAASMSQESREYVAVGYLSNRPGNVVTCTFRGVRRSYQPTRELGRLGGGPHRHRRPLTGPPPMLDAVGRPDHCPRPPRSGQLHACGGVVGDQSTPDGGVQRRPQRRTDPMQCCRRRRSAQRLVLADDRGEHRLHLTHHQISQQDPPQIRPNVFRRSRAPSTTPVSCGRPPNAPATPPPSAPGRTHHRAAAPATAAAPPTPPYASDTRSAESDDDGHRPQPEAPAGCNSCHAAATSPAADPGPRLDRRKQVGRSRLNRNSHNPTRQVHTSVRRPGRPMRS